MNRPATLEEDGWQIFRRVSHCPPNVCDYELSKMRYHMGNQILASIPPGVKEFKVIIRKEDSEYANRYMRKCTLVVEVILDETT